MLHGNHCLKEAGPVYYRQRAIYWNIQKLQLPLFSNKNVCYMFYISHENLWFIVSQHFQHNHQNLVQITFIMLCHLLINCTATGTTADYRLTYSSTCHLQIYKFHSTQWTPTFYDKISTENEGLYQTYISLIHITKHFLCYSLSLWYSITWS